MARMEDWQREAHDALRRELWTLKGYNAVVKVVPAGSSTPRAGGYITLGKFLIGKTPEQIVTALGLNAREFTNGARIYKFTRLPQASEYEYDLTAEFPGGLAYVPGLSDPSYPPGSRKVPQWKIRKDVQIPVDPIHFLELKPRHAFPSSWL